MYFQELNYQVIEEIPAYNYESLLGTCRRKIHKLDLCSQSAWSSRLGQKDLVITEQSNFSLRKALGGLILEYVNRIC